MAANPRYVKVLQPPRTVVMTLQVQRLSVIKCNECLKVRYNGEKMDQSGGQNLCTFFTYIKNMGPSVNDS